MGYVALKNIQVKVNNSAYNVRMGKSIPSDLLQFWATTQQLSELAKAGIIKDEQLPKPDKGSKSTDIK